MAGFGSHGEPCQLLAGSGKLSSGSSSGIRRTGWYLAIGGGGNDPSRVIGRGGSPMILPGSIGGLRPPYPQLAAIYSPRGAFLQGATTCRARSDSTWTQRVGPRPASFFDPRMAMKSPGEFEFPEEQKQNDVCDHG